MALSISLPLFRLSIEVSIFFSSPASNGILYQSAPHGGFDASAVHSDKTNVISTDERLRLRVDQPIEGVKCVPHSFLRGNDGSER